MPPNSIYCIFPSGWNAFIKHANSRQAIFGCVHSQTLQLVGSFLDPRRMNSCRSRTLHLCFSGDCPPSTDDLSTQHTQHVAYLFRYVSFKWFFKSRCPMYRTRGGNLMQSPFSRSSISIHTITAAFFPGDQTPNQTMNELNHNVSMLLHAIVISASHILWWFRHSYPSHCHWVCWFTLVDVVMFHSKLFVYQRLFEAIQGVVILVVIYSLLLAKDSQTDCLRITQSYGHVWAITDYQWDYTFYKWSLFEYL